MIKKLLIIIAIFLTSSCGFKVINYSDLGNFEISSISATGDNRINFNIKNKLLASSKKGGSLIEIELSSKKTREIKEKNIKNEITKYQINLTVNIRFYAENEAENINNINLNIGGNYSVDLIHSKTISNEKKLVESLIEKISDKIVNEIALSINDN